MSAEVERIQGESGLTAASSGGAADNSQHRAAGEQEEPGQTSPDSQQPGGPSPAEAPSPADMHKKCKENDKENEESGTAECSVETVKRKVVEAPPPKVNPWTKRTTGRVPINNITSSTQEKGETGLDFPSFC